MTKMSKSLISELTAKAEAMAQARALQGRPVTLADLWGMLKEEPQARMDNSLSVIEFKRGRADYGVYLEYTYAADSELYKLKGLVAAERGNAAAFGRLAPAFADCAVIKSIRVLRRYYRNGQVSREEILGDVELSDVGDGFYGERYGESLGRLKRDLAALAAERRAKRQMADTIFTKRVK